MNAKLKGIKKTIVALRSGKYKQSTTALQTAKGHCCLGVSCEVNIPKDKQNRNEGLLIGGFPYNQSDAPKWLKRLNTDFFNIIRHGGTKGIDLSTLNDTGYLDSQEQMICCTALSFSEIADMLELIYIHKALG